MTSETNFFTLHVNPAQIVTWKANVHIATHLRNQTLNKKQAI